MLRPGRGQVMFVTHRGTNCCAYNQPGGLILSLNARMLTLVALVLSVVFLDSLIKSSLLYP